MSFLMARLIVGMYKWLNCEILSMLSDPKFRKNTKNTFFTNDKQLSTWM